MKCAVARPSPALPLRSSIAVSVWAWLGRPVALPDVPGGRFQCLSYSPANDGGSPLTAEEGAFNVPDGLIAEDMRMLSRR